ncbi:uncharacterized protein LOC126747130 isoform X1 [Anthonomus grandis grandis]|uniref:uncharacterized protein LOC126747130 isoform X1 n=1 Tax=Anthonomus grandis grandis TaxID=2921223 RepID=UPI002165E521|nr:uncharacterized protein LOC126747130 isoform X1 [Anthonomus grandis grandis]
MPRLDLKRKLELVETHVKTQLRPQECALKYGISVSTVRAILTNKRALIAHYNKTRDRRAKKFPCTERAIAEHQLAQWYRETATLRHQGVTWAQVKGQLKKIVRACALRCAQTGWARAFVQNHRVLLSNDHNKGPTVTVCKKGGVGKTKVPIVESAQDCGGNSGGFNIGKVSSKSFKESRKSLLIGGKNEVVPERKLLNNDEDFDLKDPGKSKKALKHPKIQVSSAILSRQRQTGTLEMAASAEKLCKTKKDNNTKTPKNLNKKDPEMSPVSKELPRKAPPEIRRPGRPRKSGECGTQEAPGKKTRKRRIYLATESRLLRSRITKSPEKIPMETVTSIAAGIPKNPKKRTRKKRINLATHPEVLHLRGLTQYTSTLKRAPGRPKTTRNTCTTPKVNPETLPELSVHLQRSELRIVGPNPLRRKRGRPPKFLQYQNKKTLLKEDCSGPIEEQRSSSMVEVMGPEGLALAKLYKPDFEPHFPDEIIDLNCWKRKRKRKRRGQVKEGKGGSTSEEEVGPSRRLRRRRGRMKTEQEEGKDEIEDYCESIEDEDTVDLLCPQDGGSGRIEVLSNIQIVSAEPHLTSEELLIQDDVFKNVKIEVYSLGESEEVENEMNNGAEGDDEWEDDNAPMTSQPQPMPPPNQPPNSMQGGYRPPMPPNGRAPAPRGPQSGAARMPGGPRGPNVVNQRAPGVRARAPMMRPRGPGGPQGIRGGQVRPRMGGPPQSVRGVGASAVKRHPGPGLQGGGGNNANAVKRKRVDVLTPSDKDDDDCQVICMQPKNTGLPQIESVQGAESVENSIMKLSDSITLTSVRPQPKPTPVAPQKSETAKAVANVLASRGITVTSSGKPKEPPSAKQGSALPAGLNLNGSISIVAKKAAGDALPTVDLTDEVSAPAPSSPNKVRAGLPYRCDLCPATYPNALGLNKHRQTYHKTNSGMCELGVPLVNLKTPGIMQKLSQVGINNYIPLQAATPDGTYAIPLINTKQPGNVAALGATQMLSLGPVRPIPRPPVNNSPTKKL